MLIDFTQDGRNVPARLQKLYLVLGLASHDRPLHSEVTNNKIWANYVARNRYFVPMTSAER